MTQRIAVRFTGTDGIRIYTFDGAAFALEETFTPVADTVTTPSFAGLAVSASGHRLFTVDVDGAFGPTIVKVRSGTTWSAGALSGPTTVSQFVTSIHCDPAGDVALFFGSDSSEPGRRKYRFMQWNGSFFVTASSGYFLDALTGGENPLKLHASRDGRFFFAFNNAFTGFHVFGRPDNPLTEPLRYHGLYAFPNGTQSYDIGEVASPNTYRNELLYPHYPYGAGDPYSPVVALSVLRNFTVPQSGQAPVIAPVFTDAAVWDENDEDFSSISINEDGTRLVGSREDYLVERYTLARFSGTSPATFTRLSDLVNDDFGEAAYATGSYNHVFGFSDSKDLLFADYYSATNDHLRVYDAAGDAYTLIATSAAFPSPSAAFVVADDSYTPSDSQLHAFVPGPSVYFSEGVTGSVTATAPAPAVAMEGYLGILEGVSETITTTVVPLDGLMRSAVASDTLLSTATLATEIINGIRESIALGASAASLTVYSSAVAESISLTDAVRVLYELFASESITLEDVLDGAPVRVGALVERVMLLDSVQAKHEAVAAIAVALSVLDSTGGVFLADVSTAVQLTDEVLAKARVAAAALSEMLLVADLAGIRSAAAVASSALAALADPTGQLTTTANAESTALFDVALVINGEMYVGWVINAETVAPSEYAGFSFDSMCHLNGRYYGVNSDGLFLLDGPDDAGVPIAARILTGELDFGVDQIKRVEDACIGYTATGDLVLKVITTHAGKRQEHWYRASNPVRGEPTETRVVVGKGLVSRYFQFELCNVDGADFDIDRIAMRPVQLSRRL